MARTFEKVVADVQLGVKLLQKRLPPTEGNIHASLHLLQAHLSNLPDELKDVLEEMNSIATALFADTRWKDFQGKAAALLDLRREMVHAHVHDAIQRPLSGFTKELGFLKIKYLSLRKMMDGFLTAQRSLEKDLSQGISSKGDEDKILGLFLYLSEQIRVILDHLPQEEKSFHALLIRHWNELAITVINDYRLLKLPLASRVISHTEGKIVSLTQ